MTDITAKHYYELKSRVDEIDGCIQTSDNFEELKECLRPLTRAEIREGIQMMAHFPTPIILEPITPKGDKFRIVAGRHRWRALIETKQLGRELKPDMYEFADGSKGKKPIEIDKIIF